MRQAELSIWNNKKADLVLIGGSVDLSDLGTKFWFDDNSYLSILSSINALVVLRFELLTKGNVEIKLGQRLLSQNSQAKQNLYFVISQGDNKISFEHSGKKYLGPFHSETDLSGIYNFAVMNPKIEILAY